MRQTGRGIILAGLVGFMVALGYLYMVAPLCQGWCQATHAGIIDGTAEAPYRFRVLSAYLAELMPGSVPIKYILAHLIIAPAVFIAVWVWLRDTVSNEQALIGCYVLAANMLVFYFQYNFALYSMVEVGLLALALLYLRRRSVDVGYLLLIVLGTLNRETTGLLLVLAALASERKRWKLIPVAVAFGATFGALRLLLGNNAGGMTVGDVFQTNTDALHVLTAALNYLALIPVAALTAFGWKSAKPSTRRLLLIVGLPYALFVLVFGILEETRLWMPILMLALPIVLIALAPSTSATTKAPSIPE